MIELSSNISGFWTGAKRVASVLADQRKYSAHLRQSLLCWVNRRECGPLTLARIQELSLVVEAVEFWISMALIDRCV